MSRYNRGMSRTAASRPMGASRPPARGSAGKDGYHHGDLRTGLLAAAESLLLEEGVEGFTLRACARRAGVSHAAPAHHFGDVQGLLTAFAALGFERMLARMRRYRAAAAPEPVAQSRAVGQAYIDFAVANRAHFQLMFRQDLLRQDDAHLREAGQAAFDQLRSTVAAVLTDRGLQSADVEERLLLAWSTVHGFATLLLEQRLEPFRGRKGAEAFARDMGRALLVRLEASLFGERSA